MNVLNLEPGSQSERQIGVEEDAVVMEECSPRTVEGRGVNSIKLECSVSEEDLGGTNEEELMTPFTFVAVNSKVTEKSWNCTVVKEEQKDELIAEDHEECLDSEEHQNRQECGTDSTTCLEIRHTEGFNMVTLTHTDKKADNCDVFNTVSTQESHKVEKPYKCDLCDKKFAAEVNLKRHYCIHTEGKNVKNKWKHLRDNFRAKLKRMNANKSGDTSLSPSKRESQWRWFQLLLFLEGTSNARKMESNMQFQSKQLDWESTEPEKDSCTSIDDDCVAECSSADNSIHTPAPPEMSRSSAQQRSRPRSGKWPLEEAMLEIERKKLDLMGSMGNGRKDRDTTYHFLMSLWEPINRLPEDRQMFFRLKIQEMIFQESQKEKRTQSTCS